MVNYNVAPVESFDDPRLGHKDADGTVSRRPQFDMLGGQLGKAYDTWTIPNSGGVFMAYPPGYTGNRLTELMNRVQEAVKGIAESMSVPTAPPPGTEPESFPQEAVGGLVSEFPAVGDVSQERAAPRFGDETVKAFEDIQPLEPDEDAPPRRKSKGGF